MNSAAFGGWERKHSGLARNTLKDDWSVSRSGISPELFERDGRGMTRAGFWRKSRPGLRRENFPRRSSCVRFHHQPPKAAEFISPARQRWERIVLDGKPRRGDIQSNRRSLLTLPPPWVGHADDCIYSDA